MSESDAAPLTPGRYPIPQLDLSTRTTLSIEIGPDNPQPVLVFKQSYVGPFPTGRYVLRSVHAPRSVLDLSENSARDGTPIIGFGAHGGSNQTWIFESGTQGYTIKSASKGSYLSYAIGKTPVEDTTISGNQANPVEWQAFRATKGYEFRLASAPKFVIDLHSGNTEDRARICLWSRHGGRNQEWIVEEPKTAIPVTDSGNRGKYASTVPPGKYILRNLGTGTGLDLTASNPADDTPVVGFAVHRQPSQEWILEPGTRGYRFKNAASGTYLSPRRNETPRHTMDLTCNANPVEWEVVKASQAYKVRLASNTSLYLDLFNNDASNWARVCLWETHVGTCQQWDFVVA